MSAFVDLVQFSTPTTGTGSLTVGLPLTGKRTPSQAGVADGTEVSYSIIDGSNYEYGRGIIGSGGTVMTRGPIGSSNSNAAIVLSGAARVAFVLLAEDLTSLSSSVMAFNTKADFLASGTIPANVTEVRIRNMMGTWPPPAYQEAVPLSFKPVASTLGLYGEVTVGGQLFAPMYSTSPVNAGEFGMVPDGAQTMDWGVGIITATANGTTVITTSDTTGVVSGMHIGNFNWASMGANAMATDATVVSVVTNTSITVSRAVPAGTNLKFLCWRDTVTGTDNAPMLQAAVDFALQNYHNVVRVPDGPFRLDETIHLGWNGLTSLQLVAANLRGSYVGGGTLLIPSKTDRPCINFMGMRMGLLRGFRIKGRNFLWATQTQTGLVPYPLSPNRDDWLAPGLTPSGSNPGGLQQHSPYAGVTIDAYCGSQPTDHYPDRIYPAWTGRTTQYGDGASSDVTIEECSIEGFGVGICVKPNADGNADFTRIRNNNLWGNVYHIAVCHTQSRNVELRNNNFNVSHTFLTNTHFGVANGILGGPIDNCSGGASYQIFDIGMSSGPLVINQLYCESTVRLGTLMAGSPVGSSVVFTGGLIDLQDGVQNFIPPSILTSTSYTSITFIGTTWVGHSRISTLAAQGAALSFRGGLQYGATQNFSTPALRQAINYCGGMLLGGGRFNSTIGNYANFNDVSHASEAMRSSYYPADGGSVQFFNKDEVSIATGFRTPMSQYVKRYVDSQGREWQITVPSEALIAMTDSGATPVAPSYAGDVMTFGYFGAYQTSVGAMYRIDVGDILYHINTGTSFVVTAVAGPTGADNHYVITTQQQNNIRTVGGYGSDAYNFLSNANTDLALSGYTVLVKTGAVIPLKLFFGTFEKGSTSVTNVNLGDGNGGELATYYAAGDPFFSPRYNAGDDARWPIADGTRIASVTAGAVGSPGTITLDTPAICSGVFPIFPYELRGSGGGASSSLMASTFDTRTVAMAANIAPSLNAIHTSGYRTVGDGGGANYKRVSSINPSKAPYSFTSADGAHWEYIPEAIGWNAKVAGVYADQSTDDSATLNAALLPFQDPGTILNGGSLTATLLLPPSVMMLKHPVILCGNNGISIKILGQSQSASGGTVSSCFAWQGSGYPSMFIIYGANQIIIEAVNFVSIGMDYTTFSDLVNTVHITADNTMNNFGAIHLAAAVTAGTNRTFTCDMMINDHPWTSPGVQPGASVGVGLGTAAFEIVYVKAIVSQYAFVADCVNDHAVGEKVGGGTPCNNITFNRCVFATGVLAHNSTAVLCGNQIQQTVQAAQIIFDSCEVLGGIKNATVTIAAGNPLVVTDTAHGLTMGRAVKIDDANSGLTYYAIPIDADHYHLALPVYNFQFPTITDAFATLMPNASPGVVHWPGHGLAANTPVVFQTDGSLPSTIVGGPLYSTDITHGNNYYVSATGLATDTFQVSATPGGASINFTGTQYGNHKVFAGKVPLVGTTRSGTTVRSIKGHSGFRTIVGGNIKNFFIFNTVFGHLDYGFDGDPVSGSCELFFPSFAGDTLSDIRANGASNIHITSAETESCGMFLTAVGGAGQINATLVQNSYQCTMPADGVVIQWPGNLTMINNVFMNGARDACFLENPAVGMSPKIVCTDISSLNSHPVIPITASISTTGGVSTLNVTAVAAGFPGFGPTWQIRFYRSPGSGNSMETAQISNYGTGSGGVGTYTLDRDMGTVSSKGMTVVQILGAQEPGGVTSIGNSFANTGGTQGVPVYYDGSMNPYDPNDEFPTSTFPHSKWAVQQINDYGDTGKIPTSFGALQTLSTGLGQNVQGSGLIAHSQGILTDGVTSITIPFTSINSAGVTTVDISLGAIPMRSKITGIVADVARVFTGAGTCTMQVGTTSGGTDLLKAFDCTTVVRGGTKGNVKGIADADYGVNLAKATMPTADGFCPGWDGPTGTMQMSVRFIGATALTGLTDGSVTIYISTRRYH